MASCIVLIEPDETFVAATKLALEDQPGVLSVHAGRVDDVPRLAMMARRSGAPLVLIGTLDVPEAKLLGLLHMLRHDWAPTTSLELFVPALGSASLHLIEKLPLHVTWRPRPRHAERYAALVTQIVQARMRGGDGFLAPDARIASRDAAGRL